jgi:hypothetical protein
MYTEFPSAGVHDATGGPILGATGVVIGTVFGLFVGPLCWPLMDLESTFVDQPPLDVNVAGAGPRGARQLSRRKAAIRTDFWAQSGRSGKLRRVEAEASAPCLTRSTDQRPSKNINGVSRSRKALLFERKADLSRARRNAGVIQLDRASPHRMPWRRRMNTGNLLHARRLYVRDGPGGDAFAATFRDPRTGRSYRARIPQATTNAARQPGPQGLDAVSKVRAGAIQFVAKKVKTVRAACAATAAN